jgi:uncharacterized protein YjiS (DUF1127 family)
MTAFWHWRSERHYGLAARLVKADRRSGIYVAIRQMLRLWRERRRQRQELAMIRDGDLRDTGVSRDLVAHEFRKWPWQAWHPQLQAFEEAARRKASA